MVRGFGFQEGTLFFYLTFKNEEVQKAIAISFFPKVGTKLR